MKDSPEQNLKPTASSKALGYNIQNGSITKASLKAKPIMRNTTYSSGIPARMNNATVRSNEPHALYHFTLPTPTISGHNISIGMTEQLRPPRPQIRYARTSDHASSQIRSHTYQPTKHPAQLGAKRADLASRTGISDHIYLDYEPTRSRTNTDHSANTTQFSCTQILTTFSSEELGNSYMIRPTKQITTITLITDRSIRPVHSPVSSYKNNNFRQICSSPSAFA
ncbi:putative trehalose-phosphate phosphatase 2 [Dorcoceras hygrometricum]|uniref:Putative trehalose-phosphate phosphatase 2 n=1 Tax=Dorcoceras hygrometricum TaxID=472368 RepID=A0A2Z7AYU3_9LAMI|nr:putative trehalose-phosphate phosphatase 2 [Dorcoceras hygrometricum]